MGPLLNDFFGGINCTIFVYGQTGSGKTHSLFGPPKFFNYSSDSWGVCPKAMEMILDRKSADTTLTLSAVEIYFDDCFDLLNNKI